MKKATARIGRSLDDNPRSGIPTHTGRRLKAASFPTWPDSPLPVGWGCL